MMRHAVAGFDHLPGAHCGSTAMRNLLAFKGRPMSEAMAIGLGAAPYFLLFEGEGLSPSRFFVGRSLAFEQELATRLGARLDEWIEPFDAALPRLRALLDANEPVFLTTDVRWLPYFDTTSHFNGHRAVLAALHDDGRAWLADSHFQGLQEVPADAFRRSVTSNAPPLVKSDVIFGRLETGPEPPLASLVRPAIADCARAMLEGGEFDGLGGIERLTATLPEWGSLPEARWAARFGYQIVERRGTGGGLFRRLYARFLEESGERFGDAVARSLVVPCVAAADAWTNLATELRARSDDLSPDLRVASRLAGRVAVAERELWERAAERTA